MKFGGCPSRLRPVRIREFFFDRGYYEGIFDSKDEMAGIGYVEVEDRAELLRKWPDVVQQKPDFVKVMLSHSEEYDLRKDNPEFFGFRGIDPQLMPDLVELAHAEDLSLSAKRSDLPRVCRQCTNANPVPVRCAGQETREPWASGRSRKGHRLRGNTAGQFVMRRA